MKESLPVLGVGLGHRHKYHQEILAETDLLDWLEFIPENYLHSNGKHVKELLEAVKEYPVVSHGVSLSIGSIDPLNQEYLNSLKELFKITKPLWFSDHLCFGSYNGHYFNDLMPLPRTKEALGHITGRINQLQDQFELPFLIENISYYLEYKGSEFTEFEFINEILERTNAGLLCDVNNIYVNSLNHNLDAKAYIDQLNHSRIVQVHVAGHTEYPEAIIDTHGAPICEGVWELLEYLFTKTRPNAVMIERDMNLPEWSELRLELVKLNQLWNQYFTPIGKIKQEAKT